MHSIYLRHVYSTGIGKQGLLPENESGCRVPMESGLGVLGIIPGVGVIRDKSQRLRHLQSGKATLVGGKSKS